MTLFRGLSVFVMVLAEAVPFDLGRGRSGLECFGRQPPAVLCIIHCQSRLNFNYRIHQTKKQGRGAAGGDLAQEQE